MAPYSWSLRCPVLHVGLTIKELGLKDHVNNSAWDLIPQQLGIWTLCVNEIYSGTCHKLKSPVLVGKLADSCGPLSQEGLPTSGAQSGAMLLLVKAFDF